MKQLLHNWCSSCRHIIGDCLRCDLIEQPKGYVSKKGDDMKEHKFKVGDKVRYVGDSDTERWAIQDGLKIGNIYIIEDLDVTNLVILKDTPHSLYHRSGQFGLVKEELTKESALEWSIKKWEYIVENDGLRHGMLKKYPEMKEFPYDCGLCGYYMGKHGKEHLVGGHGSCRMCPLSDDNDNCCEEYDKWCLNKNEENAQKLLDKLYQIRDSKYPKYKVGDKFICIKDFYWFKKDDIVAVDTVLKSACWLKSDNHRAYKLFVGFNIYFKPYKEPEYKIGDKFVVTSDYWHFRKDDIVSIVEFQQGILMTLKCNDHILQMTHISPQFKQYFKPYEESKYKIGDKFICIKDYYALKEGKIVEIAHITDIGSYNFETFLGKNSLSGFLPNNKFDKYFKPLDKETEAILGSIKKWEDIRDGKGIDKGVTNCPLCVLYYGDRPSRCEGCPISVNPDYKLCGKTPYKKWDNHQTNKHDNNCKDSENLCHECTLIAQEEVDFLKSLLHKDTTLKGKATTFGIPNTRETITLYDGWKTIVGGIIGNTDMNDIIDGYIRENPGFYNTVKYFNDDDVDKSVSQTVAPEETKLSLKEAIDLSIKKWEWIVKHNGILDNIQIIKDIPELEKKTSTGDSYCGFCKLQSGCDGCPLQIGRYCHTFYHNWCASDSDSLKWAVELLNVIYQIKEDYEEGKLNEN